MTWQDITIAIANIIIGYSIIPQIYHNHKIKKTSITKQTSLIYSIGLYSMAAAFFSSSLLLSGIITTTVATLWLILFLQSATYKFI